MLPGGIDGIDLGDVRLLPAGVDPADGVTMTAIDGGSACLVNGRSFWVIAFRVGWVHHRDRETFEEDVDPLDLRTLTVTDAKATYAEALARAGVVRDRELTDLGGVVNVLRELAEWGRVVRAIDRASPGDVVMVDGGLYPGPFLPERFVGPIHRMAVAKGIDLVGVTKASKLRWGRYAPLVLRILRLAGVQGLGDARWYCPVLGPDDGSTPPATLADTITEPPVADGVDGPVDGPVDFAGGSSSDPVDGPVDLVSDLPESAAQEPVFSTPCEVYVARLAPRGAYAFRVDAVRGYRTPDELFALLAGASDDPAFLGYPYPLARVHQLVSLPGHLLADLRRQLREGCVRAGLTEDEADLVLRDFHLTLNA